jgi:hypothetical protein
LATGVCPAWTLLAEQGCGNGPRSFPTGQPALTCCAVTPNPHKKEDLDWTIIDQQCCHLSGNKNLADNLQVESDVYEALASIAEEMLEHTDYR